VKRSFHPHSMLLLFSTHKKFVKQRSVQNLRDVFPEKMEQDKI
jgi:hypothetical protein